MKTKSLNGLFLALLTIGIMGLSTIVFAESHGHGQHTFTNQDDMSDLGMMHHGNNMSEHMMQKGMYGNMMRYGMCGGDLTDEQIQDLKDINGKFYKATREIKQEIRVKNLELQAELAQKKPDAKKAMKIQKKLSDLEATLAKEQIEHFMEMKKINPYAMFKGGHMGKGPMGGMVGKKPHMMMKSF